MNLKKILITGGCGFIGSHTIVELLQSSNEYQIIIIDNLENSKQETIDKIKQITQTNNTLCFHNIDLCDKKKLKDIFKLYKQFYAVIHFAGLKAVSESIQIPLKYYHTNITSTINLLETMKLFNCTKFIFSSSATVYGDSPIPLTENSTIGQGITNPYGYTKYMLEIIIKDFFNSIDYTDSPWGICILRYFNPVGAHPSCLIGEDPKGIPNNLMPIICKTANKQLSTPIQIFGSDYPTIDGTGVRDFIHVTDLAKGHVSALKYLEKFENQKIFEVYNLGSGTGYSVLQVINEMKKVSGIDIPYTFAPRREGDLAEVFSDPSKAFKELGWKTTKTLTEMCTDAWNFTHKNLNQ